MQLKKYLFIPAAALVITSCGGGKDTKGENTDEDTTAKVELDLDDMKEHMLDANGTQLTIMVPREYASTGGELPSTDTIIEDGIIWQVRVGEKFCLHVEDSDGTGNYIKKEKDRLTGTGIYKLTYLVDEKNVMMYKAELVNGAGQKPFYHVFGVAKIGKRDYILKSYEQGEYNEGQINKMLTSVRALQQQKES